MDTSAFWFWEREGGREGEKEEGKERDRSRERENERERICYVGLFLELS